MTDFQKVNRLERFYKTVTSLMTIVALLTSVLIFIQIYNINLKINNQVNQIKAAQTHNRAVSNSQNSVILSYLQCIAIIPPEARTTAVVQKCVDSAKKDNMIDQNR